MKTQNLCLT